MTDPFEMTGGISIDRGIEPPKTNNPFEFQPTCNFLAGGHSRTVIDPDSTRIHSSARSAVNALARDLTSSNGPYLIVDIGLSNIDSASYNDFEPPAEVLQVNWRKLGEPHTPSDDNRQSASIACDPENPADLESLAAMIDASKPVLIILADVIGYLADPRYLLRTVRRILKGNPANRMIISTCERDETTSNLSCQVHVRHWSSDEFRCALLAAGFLILSLNHAAAENVQSGARTIVAEVACTNDFYAEFLVKYDLPPSADHAVVTTEYAAAGESGVIASYIAEAQKIGSRLIVYAGLANPANDRCDSIRGRGLLHVADLCCLEDKTRKADQALDPDMILQALQQVLFLYDEVCLLEYQDYDGIGLRIAQAKRAGLIPPSVSILAYAHGNHLYQDAIDGTLNLSCAPIIHARERLSLELADHVAFPSEYVKSVYVRDGGYKLRSAFFLPYPFAFKRTEIARYHKINTLIFYRQRETQKSYSDFIEATLKLFNETGYAASAASIDTIILIGVDNSDSALKQLPVEIKCGEWDKEQTAELLREYAPTALVALPYRDINSVSLCEIADSGCQFVAYSGEVTLFNEELSDTITCSPTPRDLAKAFDRLIKRSATSRARSINKARILLKIEADRNAAKYKEGLNATKSANAHCADNKTPGALTVVVPNLNGRKEHLSDMVSGIRYSSFCPSTVIFIDDGSNPENHAQLQNAASELGSIPSQILFNTSNLGLPSTRNIGLAKTRTPYVCVHDNDNIVQKRFFELACRILDENPEVSAVTAWARLFDDGEQWQIESPHRRSYRPLGADIGLGLHQNVLGDSLAVYRVQRLRELGGWDASSNAMWGNWQLLGRLVGMGDDVWVIPAEQFFYRVRADSMQRTYEQFPAWLRLTRIFPFLSKAQSVSLARALWVPVESPAWHVEFGKVQKAWAAENEQWAANVQKAQDAWSVERSSLEKEIQRAQAEVDTQREMHAAASTQRVSLEDEVQRSRTLTGELHDQLADARVAAGNVYKAWAAENKEWAANVQRIQDAWFAHRSSLEKEIQRAQAEADAQREMHAAASAQRVSLEDEVQRSRTLTSELHDQLAGARVAAGNLHKAWAAENEEWAANVQKIQDAWSARRSSLEKDVRRAQADAQREMYEAPEQRASLDYWGLEARTTADDLRDKFASAHAVTGDARRRLQSIESSAIWQTLQKFANLRARYSETIKRVRAAFWILWK